jgi:hypothetical protein
MNKQEARERSELMLAVIKTVNLKVALDAVWDILKASPADDPDRIAVNALRMGMEGILNKTTKSVDTQLNAMAEAAGMDGL